MATTKSIGTRFIAGEPGADLKNILQRWAVRAQSNQRTDPQATGHSWWSHLHGHASKHGAQVAEQGLGHV